jgi:RNase H
MSRWVMKYLATQLLLWQQVWRRSIFGHLKPKGILFPWHEYYSISGWGLCISGVFRHFSESGTSKWDNSHILRLQSRLNGSVQCWTSLLALSTLNRVCLSWVPGHCHSAGNEMADKLVRKGSAAILCGHEPALPLSGSTAQMMTKKWADNAHINYWESVTNCRQSKLWLVEPKLYVKKVSIETE